MYNSTWIRQRIVEIYKNRCAIKSRIIITVEQSWLKPVVINEVFMIHRITGQQYILWNFSVLTFLILQELIFQQINLLLMNNDLGGNQNVPNYHWGNAGSRSYSVCNTYDLWSHFVDESASLRLVYNVLLDKLPQLFRYNSNWSKKLLETEVFSQHA